MEPWKDLKIFKELYDKAIEDKQDVFEYDGHQILVGYAKYLLEFMELQKNVKL